MSFKLTDFITVSNTGITTFGADGIFINRTGADAYLFFQNSGTNKGAIYGGDSSGNEGLRFFVGNNSDPSIVLTPSGNLGIGTSSPTNLNSQTSLTIQGASVSRLDLLGASGAGGGVVFGTASEFTVQANYGIPLVLDAGTTANMNFNIGGSTKLTISSGGDSTFNGNATFTKDQNADTSIKLFNPNTGTSTEATIYVTNSSANADGLFLGTLGTNTTTAGGFVQDGSVIGSGSGASGGLSIMTRASADMRFYTSGHTNERLRISSTGEATFKTTGNNGIINIGGSTYYSQLETNAILGGLKIKSVWGGANSGIIQFINGTNDNVRMHIADNGQVGIGTSSPGGIFDVSYDAAALNAPRLTDTRAFAINNGAGLDFLGKYNTAGNTARFGSIYGKKENATDGNNAGYLEFQTNNVARLTISSTGVATFSSDLLELVGTTPMINIKAGANVNGRGITFDYNGSFVAGSLINYGATGETRLSGGASGTSGYFLGFHTDGSERMRISSGGDATFSGNVFINSALPRIEMKLNGGTAGYVTIAGGNNQIVTGSVSGDMAFRVVNKSYLFSVDNGASSALTISSAGDVFLGPFKATPASTYNKFYYMKTAPYNWDCGNTYNPNYEIAAIGMGSTGPGQDDGTILFQTAINVCSNTAASVLTTKMEITPEGVVAINTPVSGTNKLQIQGGIIVWYDSNFTRSSTLGYDGLYNAGQNGYLWTTTAHDWLIGTNDTVRLRISSTGHVGIGGTSTSSKLYMYGSINGYLTHFYNDGNDANYGGIRLNGGANNGSGTTYYIRCDDGDATEVGGLRNNNGTFQLYDSSDRSLKENIEDTDIKGLDRINALKVRKFNWKKNGILNVAGFVAQEVENVIPEASSPMDSGLLSVSVTSMVPTLVKAIQEQQTIIESQKSLIDSLTTRIEALED